MVLKFEICALSLLRQGTEWEKGRWDIKLRERKGQGQKVERK